MRTAHDTILDKLNEISNELRELREQVATLQGLLHTSYHEYLTIKQAAEYTGLAEQTLYRRKFLHRHFGKSVRILKSDLDNLLRRPARM